MRSLLLSPLVPVSVTVQDQAELPLQEATCMEVELAMARVMVPTMLLEEKRVLKPELEVLECEEGLVESYGR